MTGIALFSASRTFFFFGFMTSLCFAVLSIRNHVTIYWLTLKMNSIISMSYPQSLRSLWLVSSA
ncbi:hypothetical protein BDQ94DRAFT_152101 [Aspergillus welwitschiae]|uniref:Uncharacterized protein n=1 Tax=Aspergillus welwitschiae TaxID=1341132 RepID=A0A3F3PNH9_9EURO|nr:hypothetical protein BDQ94DRAFT_152101 [Aspergillus welwitschiae]RDH28511.1 hypothetical protein BDQ94DRAFT_152101 [Aspergillus welwitschiae]